MSTRASKSSRRRRPGEKLQPRGKVVYQTQRMGNIALPVWLNRWVLPAVAIIIVIAVVLFVVFRTG